MTGRTLRRLQRKLYRPESLGSLCHGTTPEKAKNVLAGGIVPRESGGPPSVYSGEWESLPDRIYLATSLGLCRKYGAIAVAEEEDQGEGYAIIEVFLPRNCGDLLEPDEDWTGEMWSEELERGCARPLLQLREDVAKGALKRGEEERASTVEEALISYPLRSLSSGAVVSVLEWLEDNPSDEEVEALCTEAPAWWGSVASRGTLALRGVVPPEDVWEVITVPAGEEDRREWDYRNELEGWDAERRDDVLEHFWRESRMGIGNMEP